MENKDWYELILNRNITKEMIALFNREDSTLMEGLKSQLLAGDSLVGLTKCGNLLFILKIGGPYVKLFYWDLTVDINFATKRGTPIKLVNNHVQIMTNGIDMNDFYGWMPYDSQEIKSLFYEPRLFDWS